MYDVIQGSMSMVTAFTPATVETMRGQAIHHNGDMYGVYIVGHLDG